MMGHREKMKGGAEYDAFSRVARKLYCYLQRSGVAKKVKRGFWKRQRTELRVDRKSTRLNSSHVSESRMPSSA